MLSYRARPALWERLAEMDRSASWLARSAGYTPQYVRMVRAGLRETVSETFARRIAAVMDRPVDDLFERADGANAG